MTKTSGTWKCVLCRNETEPINQVVCIKCESEEKQRQKAEPGSITDKQLRYIEYMLQDVDTDTSSKILYGSIHNYDGDLENLNGHQAGTVIRELKKITGK